MTKPAVIYYFLPYWLLSTLMLRKQKKIKIFSDSEKWRPMIEASVLIFTIALIYFVIYLPWQQNKNLLAVLKLNNQGKMGTIEVYAKPLSGYGMGFSESLEHISQTAIGVASNPNAPVELKQKTFDVVDGAFKKHIKKVPNDARYRLFYGIFFRDLVGMAKHLSNWEKPKNFLPKTANIF